MKSLTPAKIFGTGQVTLPKKWRDKINTKNVVIEEVPQGLLIKPLTEVFAYDIDDGNFGLSFPLGIEAKKLAEDLKKADEELS